jgi:parvulin-like peptidyl-prolyl isomerase
VRLRQIVLEKEDDAKRLMDELSDGADMTKLARQFSVAPEGENGGDTGWIDKGTLEVFDQAFKMNVGTRSKILKSPYGYHIYDVLKKEPEARLSFQEAKAKIRAQLREQSEQAVFSAWLEEQVRKTSVKRDDALIRAIKVTTRGS